MSVTVGPARFTPFARSAIEQSLVARFEEQVARHGQRTAILTPDDEWSYGELDRRASAVAQTIVGRCGLGIEPVALCLDQGAPLVAAIVGVLKAGKFYLPLEPSDPVARRREIVKIAGAGLVLDDDFVAAAARAPRDASGAASAPLAPVGSDAPPVAIRPTDPAYLFFTSGTTGTPKGVVDCHRNVLHNVYRYTNALSIAPDDRLTVIQSASFSGTVSSMFCALLNGATLLPFDFRRHGFNRLAAWIKESRATIYHSVPSIFRGVVEAGGTFPNVRVVRLEGDAATRVDYQLFQTAFRHDCILAHGLGATETGLSCQFQVRADASWDGERLPVGRPLPDMDVRVIGPDHDGVEGSAPLPNGTVGEIEIVSEFLATGYWRDPERTAARFVVVDGSTSRRAFRTGDLGIFDDAGCLQHRGRLNQEERINGQWISTPAIEAALRRLGFCRDVLVTTWSDGGGARLVAYVVLHAGARVDVPRWHAALADELPAFMIPTAFVALHAFPLGAHGKVDRRLLPAPGGRDDAPHIQPLSAAERDMVSCWERALGVTPIGTRDNFFELGGDSLQAALLVAQIERVFGRAVPPDALITAPTVEALLQSLDDAASRARESASIASTSGLFDRFPLVGYHVNGTRPPLFCIDAPACAGWEMAALAHRLSPDQPFYVVASGGATEPWPSNTTMQSLADAVIEMIRAIQPFGPVRLGGHCYGAVVATEVARRFRTRGDAVEVLALFDISPKDFPTLLPRDACHRYLREVSRRRRAAWRAQFTQDDWRPLARTIAAKVWSRARQTCGAWVDRMRGSRPPGQPTPEAAAIAMREQVLRAYQAERHEGEVVVFLPDATAHTYTNDPVTCWSPLADRVVLHLIPGGEKTLFADPALAEIATRLQEHLARIPHVVPAAHR